jgi:malonate-semialdehyde dehydrogenase (acetylating)/methylmalonate-semialdehyde dehydrogenase
MLKNYINGQWTPPAGSASIEVTNPATGLVIAHVPAGSRPDVDRAVEAARAAAAPWRNTPAVQRIQRLFKMKHILDEHADEIAEICTGESGKTYAESKAEILRAVENIEVACGMPALLQSEFSEDVARGIDEFMIRQPLGVCACIAPFNFPVMIPFWFMPYAIACGNTYIVKPSEKAPLSLTRIVELFEKAGLPQGVLNLVHGAGETVNALLDHPDVPAISFVGSTATARYVYRRGTANGKRIQAQGGAKNPVVVLPDADPEATVRILADSVFGCAGQRCLAASLIILVGRAGELFKDRLVEAARSRKTGYGMNPDTAMGPVISRESRERIESLIDKSLSEGACLLLDGRNIPVPGYEGGYFIHPTVLDSLSRESSAFADELFGPVMELLHADTLDEAIRLVNSGTYGNSACIFTRSGAAARRFRHEAMAGNIGVNIGVPAPMAFFPFSGWKDSFFGDLHAQSRHAVEFYTQTKVVVERWHDEWTRTF